ncbi:hypothetical protein KEH51_02095 [[Brevibacterium] frigoritolerans]|uniref:Uncharacterized protein n=1 Tax=Peribacillus frigoritolerans TaxID=450367 RepID=A0A941J9P2_9BACI|nr:hypothetical protein [Peribacillus frigoritolerans]
MDIAYSLLLAHRQWGSEGKSTILRVQRTSWMRSCRMK